MKKDGDEVGKKKDDERATKLISNANLATNVTATKSSTFLIFFIFSQ